jgi:enoyl-CoA hydratase
MTRRSLSSSLLRRRSYQSQQSGNVNVATRTGNGGIGSVSVTKFTLSPRELAIRRVPPSIVYTRASQQCRRASTTVSKSTTSTDNDEDDDDEPLVTFTHDKINNIGIITLNSPSTYNALSVEMGYQFESLIHNLTRQLNQDQETNQPTNQHTKQNQKSISNLNAIILKGSKHNFSSGGDLTWLRNLRHNPVHINADKMYSFYKSFLSIRTLPVPTISHIQGYAIGAGACLALATDLRVMDTNAKIGFNFVKLGIHSGMGGSHLLSNAIGQSKAKYALLTGQVFNSKEAYENGIANEISNLNTNGGTNSDGHDDETVMKLAKQIASMHPLAVRSMVQTVRMREDAMGGIGGIDATMKREAYAQALCYAKDDWGEGLDAVVEKRQPDFDTYHEYDNQSDW